MPLLARVDAQWHQRKWDRQINPTRKAFYACQNSSPSVCVLHHLKELTFGDVSDCSIFASAAPGCQTMGAEAVPLWHSFSWFYLTRPWKAMTLWSCGGIESVDVWFGRHSCGSPLRSWRLSGWQCCPSRPLVDTAQESTGTMKRPLPNSSDLLFTHLPNSAAQFLTLSCTYLKSISKHVEKIDVLCIKLHYGLLTTFLGGVYWLNEEINRLQMGTMNSMIGLNVE